MGNGYHDTVEKYDAGKRVIVADMIVLLVIKDFR
jgi:hypothetical protein